VLEIIAANVIVLVVGQVFRIMRARRLYRPY
jgi:hypothetical protein